MTDDADGRAPSTENDQASSTRPAPLEDLAREVNDRRARRSERRSRTNEQGVTDDSDPFEHVDVNDIDRERLWDELLNEEPTADSPVATDATFFDADTVDTEPTTKPRTERPSDAREHVHVVPKREYCEQCPHFSAPPEATCTHDGTEIVDVLSFEEFRVRDCPVVDE